MEKPVAFILERTAAVLITSLLCIDEEVAVGHLGHQPLHSGLPLLDVIYDLHPVDSIDHVL